MAYTTDAAFDAFYEQINLSGDHRQTANARKDRIVGLLKNDFEILDAFSTGSIPKFTALKNRADLDVMVVLHYGKHVKDKTPTQLLESVRKPLSQYRTNVRKNGQAVTLHYDTWPNVDIVPVGACHTTTVPPGAMCCERSSATRVVGSLASSCKNSTCASSAPGPVRMCSENWNGMRWYGEKPSNAGIAGAKVS